MTQAIKPRGSFVSSRAWRTFPSGMRRRWWWFRPLDLIARYWPLLKPRRGVLVIRMDGIGDMVLFRNSLDYYAEAFAVDRDRITVLGCQSWGSIANQIFAGYRLKIINEHAYAKRPLYRFRISLWARLQAPKIVVCDAFFRRALMADSLVWVTGAPRTVVSDPYINEPTRAEFNWYLSQVDEIVPSGDYPDHEIVRHARFVSRLIGREVVPRPTSINWFGKRPKIADGGAYAVLNPGSNEPGRRWPLASYKNIARQILDLGLRVVFVGTASEMAEELKDITGEPGVIDMVGKTTMAQLMGVMKHADLVISNDSGPAHVAIAMGVASVIIVGGGHFGCFFPYPKGIAPANCRFLYHRMECYHCFWRCHLRQDRDQAFPCVAGITENQVAAAVVELLAAAKAE